MCRVWRPDREIPPPLRQASGAQFNDLIGLRCYQQGSLSKKGELFLLVKQDRSLASYSIVDYH